MPRTTYEQALSMEAPRTSTSAPPTKFGEQPLPPLADTPLQETKLLHNFLTLAQVLPSFILSFTLMGNWKSYFHGSLCMCPSEEAYRNVHYASIYVLNTFWPIRLINDDVRCNKDRFAMFCICFFLLRIHNTYSNYKQTLASRSTEPQLCPIVKCIPAIVSFSIIHSCQTLHVISIKTITRKWNHIHYT